MGATAVTAPSAATVGATALATAKQFGKVREELPFVAEQNITRRLLTAVVWCVSVKCISPESALRTRYESEKQRN